MLGDYLVLIVAIVFRFRDVGFQAVQWNRAKIIYDLILAAGVVFYLALFIAVTAAVVSSAAPATVPVACASAHVWPAGHEARTTT